jgi:predicted nucleic acid-binding protein
MAYNLFIDSDILLDILLIRQPHFESSVSILLLRKEHEVELFTSPSIILNTNYIAQKQDNRKKAMEGVSELLKVVEIIETSKKILADCFNNNYTDVEDAVQYFTALQNNSIDYYITRNTRHFNFKNGELPVLSPTQFIKIFKQNS